MRSSKDPYLIKQRKREAALKRKHADLDRVISLLDKMLHGALEKDGGYHTGEIAALNAARGSLFSVRGGFVSRRR